MQDGPRILVAAALGKIIEPILRQSVTDARVRIAEDKGAVLRAIGDRLRFDAVVTDLTWMDYSVEYSFDGLDVLNALRQSGRQTPVIFEAKGYGLERDQLDEAVEQPEVVGIYRKATGPAPLIEAIDIAASGGRLEVSRFPPGSSPPDIMRIHAYFKKGKGATAARLAGAIASGRAVNHETLASTAHVGYDTAAKLVDYLGPLIKARREHSQELKMTPEVVYRWCGEHAPYILSWCRRNGYSDIATRIPGAPDGLPWARRPGRVNHASSCMDYSGPGKDLPDNRPV